MGRRKVIMDGHLVFNSTDKAAAWLHATEQTNASSTESVRGNVNRAIRDGGRAYGHTFKAADPSKHGEGA